MSHNVTITRNELIALLNQSYSSEDEVDLNTLAFEFAHSQSAARAELFFEQLLVSTYVLHAEHLSEVVTLPIHVEDPADLARPLIKALSEGDLLKYIDSTQIVLQTSDPSIIGEMLTNGSLTSSEEYDPENIRLAIHVVYDIDEPLPELFEQYECTKIRIVI